MEDEIWEHIEEFPNYAVSNYGRVMNLTSQTVMQPSLTKQGALKISLVNDFGRKTRSVKVLVADAFVEGKTDIFNTPIHLDMDQRNVCAYNLVWRPRWFSWVYTYQDREPEEDRNTRYGRGPIIDIDSGDLYTDIYHASRVNGLIWWHVYVSLHSDNNLKGVFPTGQRFSFLYSVNS
jgi:hypothetical protein